MDPQNPQPHPQPPPDNGVPATPSQAPQPGTVVPAEPLAPPTPSVTPLDAPVPPPSATVTPPQFSQPQAAFTPAPNYPVVSTGASVSARRTKLLAGIFVLLIVLLGGAFVLAAHLSHKSSPQTAFQDALSNALQTKSVTLDEDQDGATITLVANTADVTKPQVSMNLQSASLLGNVTATAYADKQVAFIKFTKFGSAPDQTATVLNKWAQLTKQGETVGDATDLLPFKTASQAMLGQFLFGNFSSSQRQQLLDYMTTSKVYKTDPSKAVAVMINGHKAWQYQVSLDSVKLHRLNEKAGTMLGVSKDDADAVLDNFPVYSATAYVDSTTNRFVKFVASQDGSKTTVVLSAYDHSKPAGKPTAQISLDDIENALSASASDTGGTTVGGVQAKAADAARETNVNALDAHLEAYYAQNGFYPTLAEINDASWRATNMKGLDPEALKDPNGTGETLAAAPAANVIAYVPTDCTGDQCAAFTLTATLSDGTQYSKASFE